MRFIDRTYLDEFSIYDTNVTEKQDRQDNGIVA